MRRLLAMSVEGLPKKPSDQSSREPADDAPAKAFHHSAAQNRIDVAQETRRLVQQVSEAHRFSIKYMLSELFYDESRLNPK